MRLPTGTGAGAALVVNAEARSGAEAFEQARHVLEGAGIALGMCVALTDPRQLGETVHAALDAGHSPIIIGGGDGSISAAADVLARHRAVLGILPLGTANDFAHTLGIPCDLEAACAVIAHGEVVEVDLGCVGEVHYLNQASMGLVGKVTEVLPHWLKRLSGPLAYPISTAVAFTRFEPFDAVLRFPAGEHRPVRLRRLLQLGVGNGHYYGGGAVIAPEACPDDGLLDIYAIRLGRWRALLSVAAALRTGEYVRRRGVRYFRATAVEVETDRPLKVIADGEPEMETPCRYSIAPAALRVLAPHARRRIRRP